MAHGDEPTPPVTAVRVVRLNLGCGTKPLTGFVNVDILAADGVSLVADVGSVLPVRSHVADLVYASHLLEHFPTASVPSILAEWRRVLRDGGSLLISVPDLDIIAQCLVEYRGWFTPPHNPWLGAVYGGQKDDFDFHKTGFNLPWLVSLLTEAGFGEIRRVEWFRAIGAADLTRALAPFGRNLSLNVTAVAGGRPIPTRLLRRTLGENTFDVLDRILLLLLRASVVARSRLMAQRRRKIESCMEISGRQ